jgi:nucleoside-diphosphate-sugar epimerase
VTHFTVLGAGGFIGAALVAELRAAGRSVRAVTRADLPALLAGCAATGASAGHVIHCVGLTGDFRTRPLATADAHVGLVGRLLGELRFDSFLLLSSTRVYARAEAGREDTPRLVQPGVAGDLYNITKLAGEALCLSDARRTIRVARLSNVYGPTMHANSFLGQVLREGAGDGRVTLGQSLRSAKDYVRIADVVAALPAIAEHGQARLYNVASGLNTSHDAIVGVLAGLGWRIEVRDDATALRFPRIDVTRLSVEFAAPAQAILQDLPGLVASLRQEAAC